MFFTFQKRRAQFWADKAAELSSQLVAAEAEAQFWKARYDGSDRGVADLATLEAASLSVCAACSRQVIGDPGASSERETRTMQETVDDMRREKQCGECEGDCIVGYCKVRMMR